MSRIDEPSGGGTAAPLRESAAQVGEDLRNLGSQARDAATQTYEQLRQQAGDYYEGCERTTDALSSGIFSG